MPEIIDLLQSDDITEHLRRTFVSQFQSETSIGIHQSRRSNYDINFCLQAATRHTVSHVEKPNTVCSIGGVEALFFLEKGSEHVVVYDCDVNPKYKVFADPRVEFHSDPFEASHNSTQTYSIVIASRLFDDGSQLVGGWETLSSNIDNQLRILRQSKNLTELAEELVFEGTNVEKNRREQKLSIHQYCSQNDLNPFEYCDTMRYEATGLCANQNGYTQELLVECLNKYHFSPEDMDYIVDMLRPKPSNKDQQYIEYALAMWAITKPNGLFIFDGDQAGLVSATLPNSEHIIYTNDHARDKDILVVARKRA